MSLQLIQQLAKSDQKENEEKPYITWANHHLLDTGKYINSVLDFRDGVLLLVLIENLFKKSVGRYYKNPSTTVFMNENLLLALKHMEEGGIDTRFMNPHGFINGNANSIMSVLWGLKRKFPGEGDAKKNKKIIIDLENYSHSETSESSELDEDATLEDKYLFLLSKNGKWKEKIKEMKAQIQELERLRFNSTSLDSSERLVDSREHNSQEEDKEEMYENSENIDYILDGNENDSGSKGNEIVDNEPLPLKDNIEGDVDVLESGDIISKSNEVEGDDNEPTPIDEYIGGDVDEKVGNLPEDDIQAEDSHEISHESDLIEEKVIKGNDSDSKGKEIDDDEPLPLEDNIEGDVDVLESGDNSSKSNETDSLEIVSETGGKSSSEEEIEEMLNNEVIETNNDNVSDNIEGIDHNSEDVIDDRIHLLEQEVEELKKSIAKKDRRLTKSKSKISKLKHKLSEETSRNEHLEDILVTVNSEMSAKVEKITTYKRENKELKKKLVKMLKKEKRLTRKLESTNTGSPPVSRRSRRRISHKDRNNNTIRLQAIARRYLANRAIKKYRMKRFTALEVVSTEETYVNNLKKMKELFYDPMMEQEMLDPNDLKTIFSKNELDVIVGFNAIFKAQMQCYINHKMNYFTPVSHAFGKMPQFLKIYTVYTNNYTKSLLAIAYQKEKNSVFRNFITTMSHQQELLGSYLVLPIQRPPRYVMLLKTLLENTPIDHEDYNSLKDVLDEVSDVARHINEKKRETEERHAVTEISFKLEGIPDDYILTTPSRLYVGEGEIENCKFLNNEWKKYYLYCFNDLLLITKKRKKDIKFIYQYPITPETRISIDGSSINIFNPDEDGISLLPLTEKEGDVWCDMIQGVIEKLINAAESMQTAAKEENTKKLDLAKTHKRRMKKNKRNSDSFGELDDSSEVLSKSGVMSTRSSSREMKKRRRKRESEKQL
eukprot:TRINITY_DN771_c0_g1_i1.p1 TRINITY_DN771_c0_g1~~TRINITY_DN771_c0_g1_i1.p1  ORF type:complete len:943 (-),score=273.03 TRINITY_DN771_c0_g1_i1:66-2894(-)